ncbi:MAG TPA: IS30 family transposase [Bacilli bacterium]|nr:IS30 family transposase [Bacilli bacterium]
MNKHGSKHITAPERGVILDMLKRDCKLKDIALAIAKDPRAVSREIRNRRLKHETEDNFINRSSKYEELCKRLTRFPFVCDGCNKRRGCRYKVKFIYEANSAHNLYKRLLRDSRQGINLTEAEFRSLDKKIFAGVSKGQSLNHIVMHAEEFEVSKRTAYRYIEHGILSVSNVDLKRRVRLRRRKTPKEKKVLVDSKMRLNRLFIDYIRFKAKQPGVAVVQMDAIESCKLVKPCLLTLHFIDIRFMLIFLLPEKTSEHVTAVFKYLQTILTAAEYKKLFPVILTDRGNEFCDPLSIEAHHETGEIFTNVFFCDPQASNQKAQIERNHGIIRYVLPKGSNLSFLTEDDVILLMNHVNSYGRELIDTTPYKLFIEYYGEEIARKLKVRAIDPDDIHLKPDLFTR